MHHATERQRWYSARVSGNGASSRYLLLCPETIGDLLQHRSSSNFLMRRARWWLHWRGWKFQFVQALHIGRRSIDGLFSSLNASHERWCDAWRAFWDQ